jgi:hypothetical protein
MRRFSVVVAGLLILAGSISRGQTPETDPVSGAALPLTIINEQPADNTARAFASVDYLMWWIKPVCLKPFTLLSPTTVNLFDNPTVVQGGYKFEFKGLSGSRLNLGLWFDDSRSIGLEGNGFMLEQGSARQFFQSANGAPATSIPFLNQDGQKSSIPFSVPGSVNGVSIATGHSWLWGAEANLVTSFGLATDDVTLRADLLIGARYLNIRDKVDVFNGVSLVGDPGTFATGAANFTTHNRFFGGQVGVRLGMEVGRWSVQYMNKLAVGETAQRVEINGSPILERSGENFLVPGPLLALPSNVGKQSSSRFTIVPEASLTFRYRWTDRISTTLGYSALYWNKVLCPGDQMDDRVNTTQIPYRGPATGARLPSPLFVQTDFFAQGYNVGFEFEF